jgi:hypothetical protein
MPLVCCPSCSRKLRVADELAGQPLRCPSCDATFDAPASAAESAPSPVQTEPSPAPRKSPTSASKRGESEPCPSCGASIPAALMRCPECHAELEPADTDTVPWEEEGNVRRDSEPHRSGLILTLSIISICIFPLAFFCSIFGIIFHIIGAGLGIASWTMGARDLKKMRSGSMDPAGQSSTQSGMVCGIVGTILSLLGVVILTFVIFIYAAILTTVFSNMPKMAPPVAAPVAVQVGPAFPIVIKDGPPPNAAAAEKLDVMPKEEQP